MSVARWLVLLLAARAVQASESVPAVYERIARKHGADPVAVYQHALAVSGRSSRFGDGLQPWPWTVRLCDGQRCERLQLDDRETLYTVMEAAEQAGLDQYIGPLGLRYAATDWPSLWAATQPLANLNAALAHRNHAGSLLGNTRQVDPAPVFDTAPARRHAPLINRVAAREGVNPALIHAVVAAESAYDPNAVSHAGAVGLMQLMPATAERFGLARDARREPEGNLRAGIRYLKFLHRTFNGDLDLMLAGYNAGEGAVERYGRKIPPYRETREYVKRVRRHLQRYFPTRTSEVSG